tara:strand:- start:91 stop:270 length:180 start_codon:yes stop_codon:yes gene_type:complete
MSYHDRNTYRQTGIAVVNPLLRIEKKLKKVQQVLDSIGDATTLSAAELKIKLQKVIDAD